MWAPPAYRTFIVVLVVTAPATQAIEGYPGSICLAVFTLLYSIIPSASTPLYSYQYTVFETSLAYVRSQ